MPVRACRGCLATEPKLFNIYKNNLHEAFGEVVGNPIFESDDLPQHICAACYAQLMKFVSFRGRCLLAQDLLEDLKLQGVKLTTSFVRNIDRNKCNLLPNLKKVTPPIADLIIQEQLCDEPVPLPQDDAGLDQDHEPADPWSPHDMIVFCLEDDPLSKSTKKINKKKTSKPKKFPDFSDPIKIEEFKNKYYMDVQVLTKEERIEDIKKKILDSSTRVSGAPYCSYCGKVFVSEATLQQHIKKCHDESVGTVQCEVCRYRLKSDTLSSHACNKIRFTCNQCGVSFINFYTAISHARGHGVVPALNKRCNYCQLVLDKKELKAHVYSKHPNQLEWCRCCGESFMNGSGLNTHMLRLHEELLKHQCQKCSIKFGTVEALERHSSLTCESFNCVMCGEHFETDIVLKDHVIKEHSRSEYIKLAQCDSCGVKFFGTDPLVKHLEEKCCGSGHPCLVCGLNFTTAESLNDHRNEHHPNRYRVCESCDKAFDADNYRHHISRVHNMKPPKCQKGSGISTRTAPKRWSVHGCIIRGEEAAPARAPPPDTHMCHYCGKTFMKAQNMKLHTRQHTGERPHVCKTCGHGFMRKQNLIFHERVHTGEKPHACNLCPKRFRVRSALNRHLVCHTELRRHVCQVCGKTFRTSSSVKIHIKGVHLKMPVKGPKKNRSNTNIVTTDNKTNGNNESQKQDLMDSDNKIPIKKLKRPRKRRVQQTDGQIEGLMDTMSDITQGGVYDTDSVVTDTNAPRIIKTVNVKRKRKLKNSLPTIDLKGCGPVTQDYKDSEAYASAKSTAVKILKATIKKPNIIAKKFKHKLMDTSKQVDMDTLEADRKYSNNKQGLMDSGISIQDSIPKQNILSQQTKAKRNL